MIKLTLKLIGGNDSRLLVNEQFVSNGHWLIEKTLLNDPSDAGINYFRGRFPKLDIRDISLADSKRIIPTGLLVLWRDGNLITSTGSRIYVNEEGEIAYINNDYILGLGLEGVTLHAAGDHEPFMHTINEAVIVIMPKRGEWTLNEELERQLGNVLRKKVRL